MACCSMLWHGACELEYEAELRQMLVQLDDLLKSAKGDLHTQAALIRAAKV